MDVTRNDFVKAMKFLCFSGSENLDEIQLAIIKKFCKKSNENIQYCAQVLLKKLAENHSEVRLSTFQIINELFKRSQLFREKILEKFDYVVNHSLGVNGKLPPPSKAACTLRYFSAKCIKSWNENFGNYYPSLRLGVNFLQKCNKVNFDAVESHDFRNVIPVNRPVNNADKEKLKLQRLTRLKISLQEITSDVQSVTSQIHNCIRILFPTFDELVPDTFAVEDAMTKVSGGEDIASDGNYVSEDETDDDDFIDVPDICLNSRREHGINNNSSNTTMITVDVNPPDETTKMALLDLYIELKNIHMKKLNRLMKDVLVLDDRGDSLKLLLDLKTKASASLVKCEEVLSANEIAKANLKCSTAKEAPFDDCKATQQTSKISINKNQNIADQVEPPVVPFGSDLDILFNSEEAVKPCFAPPIVESSAWCAESNREVEMPNELVKYLMVRTKEYVPELPPITRRCRARLANGQLCPRMDRFKCPFHGTIVDRDENGNVKNPNEIASKNCSSQKDLVDNKPWEDEELIDEINAIKGNVIQMKKKKTVRTKKRSSNLTNLKRLRTATPQKRLRKILMKASTVKRIIRKMDDTQKRQNRARFYQQFNYAFEK